MRGVRQRRQRGLSAASGFVWFVVFAVLIVATLSYKGIGVIPYPASAKSWPLVGNWLHIPSLAEEPLEADGGGVANDPLLNLQSTMSELQSRLDRREQDIVQQEADKQELEARILDLEGQLAAARDLINLQKDAQKQAVAKIYAKMNPADAVKILEGMLPERAAVILGGMGESQAAGVLAAMAPERAQLLTEIMAGYSEPSELPAQEPAVAAVQPATPQPAGTVPPAGVVPAVPNPGGSEQKPDLDSDT